MLEYVIDFIIALCLLPLILIRRFGAFVLAITNRIARAFFKKEFRDEDEVFWITDFTLNFLASQGSGVRGLVGAG